MVTDRTCELNGEIKGVCNWKSRKNILKIIIFGCNNKFCKSSDEVSIFGYSSRISSCIIVDILLQILLIELSAVTFAVLSWLNSTRIVKTKDSTC
jgi:hypothetical protein